MNELIEKVGKKVERLEKRKITLVESFQNEEVP